MLFKYKVTAGEEGFSGGGGVTTAVLLTEDTPLQQKRLFFIFAPADIPHHEVFLSSQLWLDKLLND